MSDDEVYKAVIDLASVERCWPVGHEVPQLIIDMANLISPWKNPGVGYANIKGSRFDDYWYELGADLSEQFGTFISLPDGTHISMWFHEGAVKGAEPVIELGGEGELKVLAHNLKTFMMKWAEGSVQRELDPETENATPEYLAQRKIHSEKMLALVASNPDHPPSAPIPDLPHFLQSWQKMAYAKIASDPIMQAILTLLEKQIPKFPEGADPATTYVMPKLYRVHVAGPRVEIPAPSVPPDYKIREEFPERDALIALVLAAREQRAREVPGRGLWHDAMLEIYSDKTLFLKASWEFEPSFEEGGRMTRAELEADLKRFPRDTRWMQPWMDELK
jgi:hypothetical protein